MHRIDLPSWAVARGRALNCFPALDPASTALVNIDLQNAFVTEGEVYANPHARDVLGSVNALSAALRAAGGRVIWTRQTHVRAGPFAPAAWQYDLSIPQVRAGVDALQPDARGHALVSGADVAPGDAIVDKHRYGALSCPAGGLKRELEACGVELVVITGTLSNCCCESTARELNMAGYRVIFVSDATAAVTDAEHNAALLNVCITFADVRSTAEVLAMIAAAAQPAREAAQSA